MCLSEADSEGFVSKFKTVGARDQVMWTTVGVVATTVLYSTFAVVV